MVDAHFTFATSTFDDSADVRAQNVNGIVGHSLAQWLAGELRGLGFTVSEPWAEDHGWDFDIGHDGARYLCACSLVDGDAPPSEGHVSLQKHRTLMDKFKGRNRYTPDDAVAAAIRSILAGYSHITDVLIEA